MRSLSFLTVLFCAVALGYLPAVAQTDSATAEVTAAENARTAALVHRDIAALDKLLSDDLTYTHASGRIDTKNSLLEGIRTDQLRYISWTSKEMHVRFLGNNIAVLNGEYAVKAINRSASPDTLDLNIFFLSVYVKSGGHWRQMAWQSTKDVRPPESH